MSPKLKSKSKSKNKSSAGSAKEHKKTSSTPSISANSGGGSPTSGYNPASGTFHALETSSAASSPPFHYNGHFPITDDTDEHSSSPHGTVSEYDSVSNNGSCSGESEDPKEKIAHSTSRQEAIPGSDNDKREKTRLKNERKHQRQRERRAQELHDRCNGYLMSRKLEALSQQLVAMGFPSERATLALMLNEGKVEESVAWLLEGNEEEASQKDNTNLGSGANLKIDISEELSQVLALEVRYKCSKQEVERAVVACEGDLEKAEDALKAQKQEQSATPLKLEGTAVTNNLTSPQEMPAASVTIQHRRNESDFNYPKTTVAVPTSPDPGKRNLQFLKTNQLNTLAEKRWAGAGSVPSASLNSPPLQISPPSAKVEVRVGVAGNEGRIAQQGAVREPVVVMQRPQSIGAMQHPVSSVGTSPSGAVQWYSNGVPAVENMRSNVNFIQNLNGGSLGRENQSLEHFYHQAPYKEFPFMFGPVDSTSTGLGGAWGTMGASSLSPMVPSEPQGSWKSMGSSLHSLTVPSSLGLFSGQGSVAMVGSSSHVDWNTRGLMPELDYTNIDWTLNYPSSSKSNGLLLGLSSLLRNGSGMRLGSPNGKFMSGLQDGGVVPEPSSSAGSRDWTSPFAGKDIFSVPRQFVTSPSP